MSASSGGARDSSDDFFDSFDRSGSLPPKPSQALRPPSSTTATTTPGAATSKSSKAPPPPPPPPPAAAARPSATTASTTAASATTASSSSRRTPTSATTAATTVGATTRPTSTASSTNPGPRPVPPKPYQPASSVSTAPSYYGSAQPGPAASSIPGNNNNINNNATASATTASTTTTRAKSRIAAASAAGTNPRPTTMPSYYGGAQAPHQSKQQLPSQSASSPYGNNMPPKAATSGSAYPQPAAGIQPTVFNPAAVASNRQQPQQQEHHQHQHHQQYASNINNADPSSEDNAADDWFQPETDGETHAAPVTAPSKAAPNPYSQSTLFKSSSSLEGNMDGLAAATTPAPTMFIPTAGSNSAPNSGGGLGSYYNAADFENEPPLLEELGINIEHILLKVKAVVIPFKRFSGQQSALLEPTMIVEDADLAGPTAFALLLGGELLLTGKIHFGYIYGFGVFGCLSMTLIINLLSPKQAVSVWTVTSILGYSLIPVNVLAAVKIILVNIANLATLGQILALLTILWSTTASTRLLEVGCGMRDQRYLLAYPIALLYSAFVLITIF
ncbi:hypothetical protein ACA910_014260 [Epithemia clementina (nom. ined.)]